MKKDMKNVVAFGDLASNGPEPSENIISNTSISTGSMIVGDVSLKIWIADTFLVRVVSKRSDPWAKTISFINLYLLNGT